MAEPPRMIDAAPDSVEAALLRSAGEDDLRADAAFERAMGVVCGAGAVAGLATAVPVAGKSAWLVFLKVCTLGLGVGGALVAGTILLRTTSDPSGAESAAAAYSGARSARTPSTTPITPAVPLVRVADAEPPATPPIVTRNDSTRATTRPVTPSVADEIALIDRARTSLDAGDGEQALMHLDEYDRKFPSGELVPEARVARVEALVRLRRVEDARAAASKLAAQCPDCPQTKRVRRIVLELEMSSVIK